MALTWGIEHNQGRILLPEEASKAVSAEMVYMFAARYIRPVLLRTGSWGRGGRHRVEGIPHEVDKIGFLETIIVRKIYNYR